MQPVNGMNSMNRVPSGSVPLPWVPAFPPPVPPFPPSSASFWSPANVRIRLKEVYETLNLAKSLQKELEMLIRMKDKRGTIDGEDKEQDDASITNFSNFLKDNRIETEFQESMSLIASNEIISRLRFQLEPFRVSTDENSSWEEKFCLRRLVNNKEKYKRNKLWRKRKKRKIAEHLAKERENFGRIDKEADEWRVREIAKDIAQRKVTKMKEIAKQKAKEEKSNLERELEMVLIVEKLQELRSIRIQKLKKQGHFFPEEDDKFLERVKAAVEEEERLAVAAADTDVAKDAIASAEESRKQIQNQAPESKENEQKNDVSQENQDQKKDNINELDLGTASTSAPRNHWPNGPGYGAFESAANLPMEFYHYYHGSNTDLGTLIEVRRTWDAYIRPGGSRIPGHWVNSPPPADDTWASYLIKPKITNQAQFLKETSRI